MFSGGSIPSSSAHSRKKRQGIKSCHTCQQYVMREVRAGTYFQPNYYEIPQTDHTQISRTISCPHGSILDSYHIHGMQHALHCEETEEESDKVGYLQSGRDSCRIAKLIVLVSSFTRSHVECSKTTNLPDEVVECYDRPRNIQWRIQSIRQEIQPRIIFGR